MVKRFLLLILTGACVIAPPADAAKRKHTCRSGSTVYKHDGVRVFEDGGFDGEWFACGPRSRRPTPLYSSEASYGGLSVVGQSAGKTLFVAEFSGEGGGEQTTVGWFDARTSRARSGDLAGDVSNDVRELVVAPDGGIGVVEAEETDYDVTLRVGYLAASPRKGELRGEFVLSAAGGPYVKRSLAFAGRSLSWTLADGRTRSVPLAGESVTCTSGTTLVSSGGARVFEVFPRRKTERGFQADVLAACDRGATAPRELGVTDVSDQQQWFARSVVRAGSRVAFLAGYTGLATIDDVAGTVRFVAPKGLESLDAVALGAAGPPVFAGRAHEDGQIAQPIVARLTDTGWDALAIQGGGAGLVDGSLAVGDDARVTWQTKDGLTQSVPLAGEASIDCTTGTTVLAKDGLRVLEVLPAGTDDAQLFACVPGATAPAKLQTGRRTTSWRVFELAREHDRIALYASTASGGYVNAVLSLGPDGVRTGAPTVSDAYGSIKDAAIAPDGRVALVLHEGRKWRVTGFTAGGREKVLATRTDGVRVGSLAFSPDAPRVIWSNRAGDSLSAPAP